jgi:MFS family permease
MRYWLLAMLCLAAMIAYVQRAALSVPVLQIAADLNVSAGKSMGLVQSAWYFGYAAMQLPSGRLCDRFGSRATLAVFCVAWSLLTLVTGLAPDYWSLLVIWTLMGAAQAGIFPCSTKAIGQSFPDLERARASGLLACGMAVGGALAPRVTSDLLALLGPTAEAISTPAWRMCLWIYFLPGLVWSAAFLVGVPARALPAVDEPKAKPAAAINWRKLFTSGPMALLCAQQFFRAAAMVFFLTWFPAFLQKTRGVSVTESGTLTFYAAIGGVVGSVLGGFASDALLRFTGNRRLSRQGIAVAGMSACSALIVLSYFAADVRVAIVLIGLGAFCATFGGVSGYTVAIEFGGKQVATVFSTMNMCGNIGAMLFPITAGWLIDRTGNWNLLLLLFAGIMALDAVCWAFLNPRGTLFEDDQTAP